MSACCVVCGVSLCEWCACLCVQCVCGLRGYVLVVCLCMHYLRCVCVCVCIRCVFVVKLVCVACFIYCKQEQKIQPSNRLMLDNSKINISRDLCLGITLTSTLGPT